MSYRRYADGTTISQGCGRTYGTTQPPNPAVRINTGRSDMGYRILNLTGYTILVYAEDDDMWNDAIPAWEAVTNRVGKPGKALLIESPPGQTAAGNPNSSLVGVLPGVYVELISSSIVETVTPSAVSWPLGSGPATVQEFTSQPPQGGNLVASTTQAATWTSPDFVMPAYQGIAWFPVVTSIVGGTAPTIQFFVQLKLSDGSYRNYGVSTASLSATGAYQMVNALSNSGFPVLTIVYRIQAVITGAPTGITFFIDQYYK